MLNIFNVRRKFALTFRSTILRSICNPVKQFEGIDRLLAYVLNNDPFPKYSQKDKNIQLSLIQAQEWRIRVTAYYTDYTIA